MSGRKQKSPDPRRPGKKQQISRPGLPLRLLMGAGGLVARHPRPLAGFAGFAVLFSFVAANALWYQPGGHPSPFLATRDPRDPDRIAGYRANRGLPADDVTTFRIERAPDQPDTPAVVNQPASAPANPSTPSAAPFPARIAAPLPQPMPAAQPQQDSAHQMVADVQRELAGRGLYDGAEDGVMGSRTAAAILFYQESAGLPQTGEASPELLASLKGEPRTPDTRKAAARTQQVAAPLPKPAPTAKPSQSAGAATPSRSSALPRAVENVGLHADDPIAAAIRSSERAPSMTPPADIPTGTARPIRQLASATPGASPLVLQIQKGLSNIAYTDVEMDGVAGAQTKAAIRRFEKHYRLPETGEPNEAVLKKLKAIGAL